MDAEGVQGALLPEVMFGLGRCKTGGAGQQPDEEGPRKVHTAGSRGYGY